MRMSSKLYADGIGCKVVSNFLAPTPAFFFFDDPSFLFY